MQEKYLSESKEFKLMSAEDKAKALIEDAKLDSCINDEFTITSIGIDKGSKAYIANTKLISGDYTDNDEIVKLFMDMMLAACDAGIAIYKMLKFVLNFKKEFKKLEITELDFVKTNVLPLVDKPDEVSNKKINKIFRVRNKINKDAQVAKSINGFNPTNFVGSTREYSTDDVTVLPMNNVDPYPTFGNNKLADMIHKNITFIENKHNGVSRLQLLSLINLINSDWLKSVLSNAGCKCNPEYPILNEIEYPHDGKYDMALEVETVFGNNMVVLFGSVPYVGTTGVFGNNCKIVTKEK